MRTNSGEKSNNWKRIFVITDNDEVRVHWDLLRANMSCRPIEPLWTFVSRFNWWDLKVRRNVTRLQNGTRQKVTQYLIAAIKTEPLQICICVSLRQKKTQCLIAAIKTEPLKIFTCICLRQKKTQYLIVAIKTITFSLQILCSNLSLQEIIIIFKAVDGKMTWTEWRERAPSLGWSVKIPLSWKHKCYVFSFYIICILYFVNEDPVELKQICFCMVFYICLV